MPKTPALPTGLSSLVGLGTHGSHRLQQSRAGQLPAHRPGQLGKRGPPASRTAQGSSPCAAPASSPQDPPGACSRDGGAPRGPAAALPGGEGGGQGLQAATLVPAPSTPAPGGKQSSRWLLQVAGPGCRDSAAPCAEAGSQVLARRLAGTRRHTGGAPAQPARAPTEGRGAPWPPAAPMPGRKPTQGWQGRLGTSRLL